MALDCLEGLVGLDSKACDCVSASRPSAYNDSESGYYLTDYEYGFPLRDGLTANAACDDTIWDMLEEARDNAIRDFKYDMQQALSDNREAKVINWRGNIAHAEGSSYHRATVSIGGLQIRPKFRMKDAVFVIKAIHLGLDASGTYEVTISSNDPDFSTETVSCQSTAGSWRRTELATAVSLPLYNIVRTDLKYNVHFEPAGAGVRANRIWCGCGSRPQWMQHLFVGGGSQSATWDDDLELNGSNSFGLALEGYFTCNKLDWICDLDEMNGMDFRDLVARCIQLKGAVKLLSMVIESGRVNYFTLLDQEALYAKRGRLQKMYSENLLWIAQNLPANISSCWGCDKYAPQMNSILT